MEVSENFSSNQQIINLDLYKNITIVIFSKKNTL